MPPAPGGGVTHFEITTVGLTVIGVLLIPLLGIATRAMVKWIRTEDRLDVLVRDVRTLVTDEKAVHKEMSDQMKYDRDATNKRLIYLERGKG
jgi:hypothetical protein